MFLTKHTTFCCILFSWMFLCSVVWGTSPFGASCELLPDNEGTSRLVVSYSVTPGSYLYEESLMVQAVEDGVKLDFLAGDTPLEVDGDRIFDRDFKREYRVAGHIGETLHVEIGWQGCQKSGLCFLPEKCVFELKVSGRGMETTKTAELVTEQSGGDALDGFEVRGSLAGYVSAEKFLDWLKQADAGTLKDENNFLQRVLKRYGLWLVALLLLPLGAALNLTPCILPMIPINLAILGAGGQSGRGRGFVLGLAYGAGMALAYGVLGVVVVLTGSRFGAINSSPWFNFAVAIVFICLALAMFDVFAIDFSRYRNGKSAGKYKGTWLGAAFMGGLTALLAGACVAPVLIWALVMATEMVANGRWMGLALPFLLGVGLALPWPLLGAGISKLPRPGQWMSKVKKVFGVLILFAALYYVWIGMKLWAPDNGGGMEDDGWRLDWAAALQEGRGGRRPVLLDFWGRSCKNCVAMDKTTLLDGRVVEWLEQHKVLRVKVQGDDESHAEIQEMLKKLEILGFPTYIYLK